MLKFKTSIKSKYIILLSVLSCFMLAGCAEGGDDFQLNSDKELFENIGSEIELYKDDSDDMIVKGEFILYAYKKVYSKSYKKDFEEGTAGSYYYIPLYQDTYTGCIYIIDSSDGYSPYLNNKGEVSGCYDNSTNTSEKDTNLSKLEILKQYYPGKENSELEYMLESIFDADSISEEELISVLENMKRLKESKKGEKFEPSKNTKNDEALNVEKEDIKNIDNTEMEVVPDE